MAPDELFEKINAGKTDEVLATIEVDPALVAARDRGLGRAPLIFAANRCQTDVVTALLDGRAEYGGHAELAALLRGHESV